MSRRLLRAFLALPVVVRAAAFLPTPTVGIAEVDYWSPATTDAPRAGLLEELLRRQEAQDGARTCGYLGGNELSSITCLNSNDICATDTFNGVHSCCNPASMSDCNIPTACIPSASMSASCTDSFCSDDAKIAKCTATDLPNCYEYHFVYEKTTMTEFGCDRFGFTQTALRSPEGASSSTFGDDSDPGATVTVTAPPTSSSTTKAIAEEQQGQDSDDSKPGIGVIVGATIGACVFLSIIGLAIFLIHRRRTDYSKRTPPGALNKKQQSRHQSSSMSHHHDSKNVNSDDTPGMTEANSFVVVSPDSYSYGDGQQRKTWESECTVTDVFGSPEQQQPPLQYPGQVHGGAVEAHGMPVTVYHEAPTWNE